MKKLHLLIALTGIFFASIALANNSIANYYSSFHPSTASKAAQSLHPPTDITVINASSDYIYVIVPNSPVYDRVAPGYNDHITNYDPNVWSTYLVLQDPNRVNFYSLTVCQLAIMTVYGRPGSYRINTDSHLCN